MTTQLNKLSPLGQKIIFKFMDNASEKAITNTTSWNFEVKAHEFTSKSPRWVEVVLVGDKVPDYVKPGHYALVEALMWTHGFDIDGVKHWATDYEKLLGFLEEKPTGIF